MLKQHLKKYYSDKSDGTTKTTIPGWDADITSCFHQEFQHKMSVKTLLLSLSGSTILKNVEFKLQLCVNQTDVTVMS